MITRTLRLFNFLIDSFFFLILVFILTLLMKSYLSKEDLYLGLIAIYYLYYLVCEFMFGQTIGKWLTRTKVVGSDERPPSFWNVLVRTLLRMLPFDFISYLVYSQGIHDKFSRTKLIKL